MNWIFKTLLPIIKFFGSIGLPKRKTNKYLFDAMMNDIRDGDIILLHKNWEFSNLFIPGFWKHSALYAGNGNVIHSIGKGVLKQPMEDVFFKSDYFLVIRKTKLVNKSKIRSLVLRAESLIGGEYDYEFSSKNKKYYCSELIHEVFCSSNLIKKLEGIITPQDLYESKDFYTVCSNKEVENG